MNVFTLSYNSQRLRKRKSAMQFNMFHPVDASFNAMNY